MNEKKDTAQILDEIISSGEEILSYGRSILESAEVVIQAIKDLKEIFTAPDVKALTEDQKSAELPENSQPEKEYTFEEVRGIMAGLAGQGKKAEARALLQKYGVSRLSDLDAKNYTSLAEEAKVIANG